ncbi:saccharopine dehydrogenase family protein [Parendozoicomonas haliclonae]|uniref:Putative trans-acting enoyl reductase n=1 Tax=Parendozoicomonas haliclonae TaxID=1960125 RepID=A0A1X7AFT2_9GAMM|nr:saccharopine dehydrogenase NADP-binding domain-containing protein [Parendozoicomonas haliclonae]SMA36993.1 putative trans-acting enoyl reductase [Parendozoicomonas haliclonae]
MKPSFDLVVYGATSFVGQILVKYLANYLSQNPEDNIQWAMAGRSQSKLDEVRSSIPGGQDIPLLIADAEDEEALRTICSQTRVVISTVGPYALYGSTLVKVCAETGTDYCDLTGEVQWIKRMVDRFEPQAKQSGARIVHCCGFDSIPSDLGVAFLQKQAREQFGQPCTDVKMRVKAMKGGMSGGTVASIVNITKEVVANPALRKDLANPYLICPPEHSFTARQPNQNGTAFDSDFQAWTAPFIMAGINTRVVHRSNALSGNGYGENFTYSEAVLTGKGMKGRMTGMSFVAGLGAFMVGAALKPTRWFLESYVLPKPGEGPSPEAQLKGFYDLRFVGKTADGQTLKTKVTGDRDPGYGSTAKMLAQAGLCLALNTSKEQKPGGFWTTASVFDETIFERLTKNAGLTFEVQGSKGGR